jgi:Glucose / Sorbosone dehydrogenase
MCLSIPMRSSFVALFLSVGLVFAQAKKPAKKATVAAPVAEASGQWILGTVGVGKQKDGSIDSTGLKGLAVRLGDDGKKGIAYDLDLCRPIGAWAGRFTTEMNLMSRGDYPTAIGETLFVTGDFAGFMPGADAKSLAPRKGFGPLPVGQARFKGFHNAGRAVVVRWQVGEVAIDETAEVVTANEVQFVVRTLEVAPSAKGMTVMLGKSADAARIVTLGASKVDLVDGHAVARVEGSQDVTTVRIAYLPAGVPLPQAFDTEAPSKLLKVAKSLWPETVETAGKLSEKAGEPYVVDDVKLPVTNPWKAPMFTSAFDFLPDGRAVICTFHGDVFIASGIDAKLEKVTWRRFAAGLYHALGLKVVNGEIFVTCRDGVWKLRDTNGDGECDTYEAFNFDLMVTKSFHEFTFDLQTDPAGNFYVIKAGPVRKGGRGFDEICDHHGSLLRISPDGKKSEVFATGFRAPNGIAVSPTGQITTGDNEGTWTPVCRLNWIKQGGFYGVPPLAHRATEPTDYDRPLCWFPKEVDNSSGGQVWVTSDKFGPWKDRLLHLSYGTCSLFGVMPQEVTFNGQPQMQGGVARFNVDFASGAMRARFNPKDGQLYVTGLRGWQTTATQNGCFQRVRYTGAATRMPLALAATKKGIKLDFACELDAKAAADAGNWNVEIWNYVWSSAYGSPDVSTLEAKVAATELGNDGKLQFSKAQMSERKHDPLVVKSATLSDDRRSVFLEIPEIRPAMQMQLKYEIKAADGLELRGQVINTIHALAE